MEIENEVGVSRKICDSGYKSVMLQVSDEKLRKKYEEAVTLTSDSIDIGFKLKVINNER